MIRIELPQVEAERLQELFQATDNRKLRDRLQIVLMAHRGRSRQDIAQDLGIHRRSVTRWLNAYCEGVSTISRHARPRATRQRSPRP